MSFQAPKGVSEYVPPRSALFEEAREAFASSARRACYGAMETAVFEDTALFVRGVGESSDVVRKEMYSFTDRGDRELTLRPEFTAGVPALRSRAQPAQGRAAGEGVDVRPGVPLRAAAGRPVPAVLPVRPGGDRHRGPGGGRGDDRGRLGRLPGARPAPVHAAAELPRRQELPPRLPRGAAEVPARPRPGRRDQGADRAQPAARARRQASRGARAAGRAPRCMVDYLCGDCKTHHDTVRAPAGRASTSRSPTRRAWSAAWTTTTGPRTSSTTRCSAPSRASAAAAGTTGFPRTSAARRCPASGSRSAWTV